MGPTRQEVENNIHDMLSSCDSESRLMMISTIRKVIDSELLNESIDEADCKCPHCGSMSLIHYGTTKKGTQRYQCCDCKKVFTLQNVGKILRFTKLPYEKWTEYAECFVDHLTSSAVCKKLEVSMKTAWFMRVRVMEALFSKLPSFQVKSGLGVEIDEIYFNESFKGTKFEYLDHAPREPWSDTNKAKPGISNDKICVLTAFDDSDDFFFDVVCRGALTHDIAMDSLKGRICSGSIVNTDEHHAYKSVLKELNVAAHVAVKAQEEGSVTRLNDIHQDIRIFMAPFRGVSTKWLSRYLGWYKWIRSFQHNPGTALKQICSGDYIHKWRSIGQMAFPFRDVYMNETKL